MTETPVLLTDDAARDLDEIYARVHLQESWSEAVKVLDVIAGALTEASVDFDAHRYPAELFALGIHDYQEAGTGDYRVIYRSEPRAVYVLLIVEGHRDLRSLLERRLLEA